MRTGIFICVMTLSAPVLAAVRSVPAECATIQSAIVASGHGDTELVAPGTYRENINFGGKDIVVASHFVLDGDLSHITAAVIDGSAPEPTRILEAASCSSQGKTARRSWRDSPSPAG